MDIYADLLLSVKMSCVNVKFLKPEVTGNDFRFRVNKLYNRHISPFTPEVYRKFAGNSKRLIW